MPTLKKSDGTVLSSAMGVFHNRRITAIADGTLTTAGTSGYDTVTLIASRDAAYAAATSNAPVRLGIDNIIFKPMNYPQP